MVFPLSRVDYSGSPWQEPPYGLLGYPGLATVAKKPQLAEYPECLRCLARAIDKPPGPVPSLAAA
eukprot:7116488-Pyramimonas_sp.AAC.1